MRVVRGLCLGLMLFMLCTLTVSAQRYQITGSITEANTKRKISDVPVSVKERAQTGTSSGEDGKYSIRLPQGSYTLVVKFIGYKDKEVKVNLNKDIVQNIELEPSSINLDEVVVSTNRSDANISAPQTGVEKMTMQEVSKLPVLLGERDVIKAIQLMPGVKAASEGGSGFFVRGGTADQNMVSLDNVSVYNASHLMGFFSTFNPDAVRDVTLYKGAMPAQYGERLASVLDVQMRDGDNEEYHLSGGIGLISSKLSVEGPLQKGKSSFILSGRRTYADAIARLAGSEDAKNTTLYFYDLNAKLNFNVSDKDRISFSGYWGKDKLGIKEVIDTDWGNLLGTLRWTHQMNGKVSLSTALQFNQYDYHVDVDMNTDLSISSRIKDYTLKQDLLYDYSPNSRWRFGYSSTYHDLDPGLYEFNKDTGEDLDLKSRYSWENGIYASHSLKLTDKLEAIYGLRVSAFSALGKGEYYTLNENNEVIDSTWYSAGKFVKTYINLEPRLSMVYKLNKFSSLKAAYGRTTQNMHLLTNTNFNSPMDRWTMSSNNIKPQIADQVSLGYFRNFSKDMYEFSVEAYYKDMRNQIDFKDNAEFETNDDLESELLYGKGRAYGVEFLLKKKYGRLTGWVGYTLSKSEKQIDGINNDEWYDARQDRTHDISIVGMYDLNKKWSLSAAWVYYTGNAVTYPSAKYHVDGREVVYYSERNGYRAPAYHRLDLGATCILKKTKKYYSELAFSLYNAYGRENAYMIDFRTNDDDPSKSTAYQYSLFRFVPSVSWNFKF
ncbi:MAG: TonB-dependent receptor [Dysgonomonas sp.]|nr:TonB-dependent receptor [Dysgonomonas sp.]